MDFSKVAMIIGFTICGAAGLFIAKSKLSTVKTSIIAGLLILPALFLIVGSPWFIAPYFNKAFSVSDILFYQGKDRETVLVFSRVGSSGLRSSIARISVLNAKTGELLGTDVLGFDYSYFGDVTRPKLLGYSDDKVWIKGFDHGMHARDPYTGKLLLTEADILEKYPQLTSFKKTEIKTDDGYVYQINPPDFYLQITNFPESQAIMNDTTYYPYKIGYGSSEQKASTGKKTVLTLKDNDPADPQVVQLMRMKADGYAIDSCVNKTLNFRQGFFINNSGIRDPHSMLDGKNPFNAGFINPTSLLIGHREITEGRTRKLVISRVDYKGKLLWDIYERDLGGEPTLYYTRNGTLYMTIEGRLLAFDPATGIKKWETQL